MSNNDNQKKSSLPEGLSSIADDEAITEINLTDFLEESSKSSPLFEGFHEDIEKTEKSLESELQSLYDDIMSSGPETIVPKPMSVLTASEAEPAKVVLSDPEIPAEDEVTSLDELWMNPEDYFDDDIPVVSLDGGDDEPQNGAIEGEIPEDAFFAPAAVDELAAMNDEDKAKSDIFSMIDLLKSESDKETGFDDILSEIELNSGIAPVATELSVASQLVSESSAEDMPVVTQKNEEAYEELVLDDEEFDWNDLEFSDDSSDAPEAIAENSAPEAEEAFAFTAPEAPDEAQSADVFELSSQPEVTAEEADFDIGYALAGENSKEDSNFDMELAELLGDPVPAEKTTGFVIDIPDEGFDDAFAPEENAVSAPAAGDALYVSAPMSTQSLEDDPDLAEETEGKKGKKKKAKKAEKKAESNNGNPPEEKKGGAGDVIRKIVLSLSIITIIVSCGILVNTYFIEPYRFKADADALAEQMSVNNNAHEESATVNNQMQNENPEVDFPEGMLAKYAQLYAQNNDFSGWITIEGLGINLPIAQGSNNEYYLKRDIFKKYTSYGVPFFDYRMSDLRNLHKNTMVYGHNMRHDDYIFGMLENYRKIEGFAQAPVIECDTIFGDHTWFVYAVYITNSTPGGDNGYFMPYNFIDISNAKFREYIDEIDKRKLYTTGVDINENDKILTLQACVYDFDGAMIIVVAREKREGESISVDTSKAYYNPNPKYPQAWYDANKKTNPYAEDSRW